MPRAYKANLRYFNFRPDWPHLIPDRVTVLVTASFYLHLLEREVLVVPNQAPGWMCCVAGRVPSMSLEKKGVPSHNV